MTNATSFRAISFIRVTLLAITLLASALSASIGHAGDEGAKLFTSKTSDEVLSILKSKHSDKKKEDKLNKLFDRVVNSKWIGKFVMGRHWRTLSEEQQKEYLTLYTAYLRQAYVSKFKEYNNQKLEFGKTLKENKRDTLVKTNVIADNKTIEIDYKVRSSKGRYAVIDIIAEGISLINTQRSEFDSIVSRKGASDLLRRLKSKIGS